MAIKILTDSCSDICISSPSGKDVEVVPLTLTINQEVYLDGVTINHKTFYEKLVGQKIFPKTSQPAPQEFLNHFEKAKESNDELIVITISSALSGTFQSAKLAKEIVDYDKIYIIDSLSATAGEQILIDIAVQLIKQQKSGLEIFNQIEKIKTKLSVTAMINTLEYLQRGGRLTKTQALIGDIINLKPIITITNQGSLSVYDKAIGKKRSYKSMLKYLNLNPIDLNYPYYFIYSTNIENTHLLLDKINETYHLNIKPICCQIGPTIGSHIGPNAFGIIYIKK